MVEQEAHRATTRARTPLWHMLRQQHNGPVQNGLWLCQERVRKQEVARAAGSGISPSIPSRLSSSFVVSLPSDVLIMYKAPFQNITVHQHQKLKIPREFSFLRKAAGGVLTF